MVYRYWETSRGKRAGGGGLGETIVTMVKQTRHKENEATPIGGGGGKTKGKMVGSKPTYFTYK